MIVDNIKNYDKYLLLHPNFKIAFEYLNNTDFSNKENGIEEIKGREVFAIINSYQTKESGNLEGHQKYIDIQFIASGEELIGYVPLEKQESIVEYNKEDDYQFFKGESSFIKMVKGMFAIFNPQDLHLPGIISSSKQNVKKVVIKIAVL